MGLLQSNMFCFELLNMQEKEIKNQAINISLGNYYLSTLVPGSIVNLDSNITSLVSSDNV